MRRIKIAEHVSLDGVIQPTAPGRTDEWLHGGWTAPFRTPEGAAATAAAYGENFDLLLGRRTYDLWASFWPKMKGGPFADKLNAATKYVATHRPESLSWGPIGELGSDPLAGIRQLRNGHGPDLIVCGSATLTTWLLNEGLVDEVVLAVYPLLLGPGKRWFPEKTGLHGFKLMHSMATSAGVMLCTYESTKAL